MRPETLDDFAGQEQSRARQTAALADRARPTDVDHLWGPPGVGQDYAGPHHRADDEERVPAVQRRAGRDQGNQGGDGGCRTAAEAGPPHDSFRRRNSSLQQGAAGRVSAVCRAGRHRADRRDHREPSFEVNAALLSRSKVYMLRALTTEEIVVLLRRALPVVGMQATDECWKRSRPQRTAMRGRLTTRSKLPRPVRGMRITAAGASPMRSGRKVLLYDKTGEEHYNLISALHKSVRSSDPDAALYWLARMLESGEDRMYIARRVVRMAIEDIGLADPRALEQCMAMQQCVHFLGIPEGDLAIAQAVIYLAVAPKSDAAYRALGEVTREVQAGARRAGSDASAQRSDEGYEGLGLWSGLSARASVRGSREPDGVPARIAGGRALVSSYRSRPRKADRGAARRDPQTAWWVREAW